MVEGEGEAEVESEAEVDVEGGHVSAVAKVFVEASTKLRVQMAFFRNQMTFPDAAPAFFG